MKNFAFLIMAALAMISCSCDSTLRLSREDEAFLQAIYSPEVVGIPLADARKDLCVMKDGEIRSYGPKDSLYLSSTDYGLTWKKHRAEGRMLSAKWIPGLKLWVKCDDHLDPEETGTFALVSRKGPEDPDPTRIKVSDTTFNCAFLPQVLSSGRVFFTAQVNDRSSQAGFFYSDDGCKTFSHVVLPPIPPQEPVYPHKGLRWSVGSGSEPVACEIGKDSLMMLLRNSRDCFYQAFSYDGGSSWTEPEPSPFQGTDTTPFILRLKDGRILVFWNNTRPLPELSHEGDALWMKAIRDGLGEDFFTNRDASHVAISDDGGRIWKGARELYLNGIRNNPDFRFIGTRESSNDKSVHQFQAIELPLGKVLVALGQNEVSRKMLIFDPDWLYEKDREEDFNEGLVNVSTQVYVKSSPGHTPVNGHCAYNRTNGALKAIDPGGYRQEAVQICRIDDPRLVSPIQGVVWNFPASLKGEVVAELYLADEAVNISLSDCWFNPCDSYAPESSLFTFHLDSKKFPIREYHEVSFGYDLGEGVCRMYIDGRLDSEREISKPYSLGLSYLIIQCDAPAPCEGTYLRKITAHGI
ncbi:MAG: exo-alpha-sialidase [Bacteroidales bacterium]|nr:exo-alpha-sialidase [Bacteroidales bacterium]